MVKGRESPKRSRAPVEGQPPRLLRRAVVAIILAAFLGIGATALAFALQPSRGPAGVANVEAKEEVEGEADEDAEIEEADEEVEILRPAGSDTITPIQRDGDWYMFQVQEKDAVGGKSGRRSEFFYGPRWSEGDEAAFGFSFFLPPGFEPSSSWNYIAQIKKAQDQGGFGGPPVGIAIDEDGDLALVVRGPEPFQKQYSQSLSEIVPGTRYDVVLGVRFSSGPDGYVEAWLNGQQVMPTRPGPTLYADGSDAYVRTGYYLGKPDGSGVVYSARPRIGRSVAAVVRSFDSKQLAPSEPEVTFSARQNHVDGETVSGMVPWDATVSGGAVSRVEFLIDGEVRWTEELPPYCFGGDESCEWDTTGERDGSYVLGIRAVASDGRTSSSTARVRIQNGQS